MDWIAGLRLFLFLTWVIGLAGVPLGFFLSLKMVKPGPGWVFLLPYWILLPIFLLLSFVIREQSVGFFQFYLVTLAIFLLSCALAIAYGAKLAEQHLERTLIRVRWIQMCTRIVVIFIGSAGIAIATSALKSVTYHFNVVDYEFSPELKEIMSVESHGQIETLESKIEDYKFWLTEMEKLENETFFTEWTVWSFITRNYNLVPAKERMDYQLEYDYTGPKGEMFVSFHKIYFKKPTRRETEIQIPGPSSLMDSIPATMIISSLQERIEQTGKIVTSIEHKPPAILALAFASFLELFSSHELIHGKGNNAQRLDTLLLWLAYFLNIIVFYIVPTGEESRTHPRTSD